MVKVIILSLFLTACSWTDVLDFITPSSGGVDTEIVVGDKNQSVTTEFGKQTAQTIVNNETTAWFPYILAMIALMLPTPTTMWNAWRNKNGR